MARNYYRIAGAPLAIVFGPGTLRGAAAVQGLPKTGNPEGLSDAERLALGIRWADEPAIGINQTHHFVSAVYNAGTGEVDETWSAPVVDPAVQSAVAARTVQANKNRRVAALVAAGDLVGALKLKGVL